MTPDQLRRIADALETVIGVIRETEPAITTVRAPRCSIEYSPNDGWPCIYQRGHPGKHWNGAHGYNSPTTGT